MVDDAVTYLSEAVYVSLTSAVVTTLDCVVEEAVNRVTVVLVVLRGVDTALRGDGVSAARAVGDAEHLDVEAQFAERRGGGSAAEATAWLEWLKPDAWMPILALIGICLIMFISRGKKRDVGFILMGFAVLMVGMDLMSGAVKPLANVPEFTQLFTLFTNPVLGLIVGAGLTAVIQSSSASVGILQTLALNGIVSWKSAIFITLGQNIGTCVTALISTAGANRTAKRAGTIHMLFNVMGAVIWNKEVMPVDTHVFRVSARIGLSVGAKTPRATELQLEKYIPSHLLPIAHHWLILHGRYTCLARKPKCEQCGITTLCNYYQHHNR